jgi:hypothetical protein
MQRTTGSRIVEAWTSSVEALERAVMRAEDTPARAVALLESLEELGVGVAAELLQGLGGGVRDGGGGVEEVREEGRCAFHAERAKDAADGGLLAWARARGGLDQAADGGGGETSRRAPSRAPVTPKRSA